MAYWVNGRQVQRSSRSTSLQDAKRLRDEMLGKKARGESVAQDIQRITCGELLDDLLEHLRANAKPSTLRVWTWCIDANIRPHFGRLKASRLTTQTLRDYRAKRRKDGRSEATCNRELSILRTALNLGKKQTPPKVQATPYFPMVREDSARQGFLSDDQYVKLRDALPEELRPIFVAAYFTGVRLGELLAWTWDQVDWEQGFVTLQAAETKSGHARAVPIHAETRD